MCELRSCELQRERDSVESAAQLEGRGFLIGVEPKGIRCLGGPREEERERGSLVQAWHTVALLTRDIERFAACGENPRFRPRTQQLVDEGRHLVEQVLAVVQHEQDLLAGEEARHIAPVDSVGQRELERAGDDFGNT